MALKQIDLFCPDCKEQGKLWITPKDFYRVNCEKCGMEWEHNELNEICWKLIKRAESDRKFQWWSACLRIQMQHNINPVTGRSYV